MNRQSSSQSLPADRFVRAPHFTRTLLLAADCAELRQVLAHLLLPRGNLDLIYIPRFSSVELPLSEQYQAIFNRYNCFEGCQCSQIPPEDLPFLRRRYFVYELEGETKISDVYGQLEGQAGHDFPPTLRQSALLQTQILFQRWAQAQNLLHYHYSTFRQLQDTLALPPFNIPPRIGREILPSLFQPYYFEGFAVNFSGYRELEDIIDEPFDVFRGFSYLFALIREQKIPKGYQGLFDTKLLEDYYYIPFIRRITNADWHTDLATLYPRYTILQLNEKLREIIINTQSEIERRREIGRRAFMQHLLPPEDRDQPSSDLSDVD